MKVRLAASLVACGLLIALLSGPVMARPVSVEKFLGPEAVGWCDTLVIEGDRARIGHAKARYTGGGQVAVRLKLRNLAPNQLHRVLLHQQGDPFDPGYCNFSDVHYVISDSKGRIRTTLKEPAISPSDGMFVALYAADVLTDQEAFIAAHLTFVTTAAYTD